MRIITPKHLIDDYFNSSLTQFVNQSSLKKLIKGVDNFIKSSDSELYYEERGHFIIGSGVDTWLTQGVEEFENEFYKQEVAKPSDKVLSICHKLYDLLISLDYLDEFIANNYLLEDITNYLPLNSILSDENYYNNYKESTKVNKFIKDGSEYFSSLIKCDNRQICSPDEWATIHKIVYSLQDNNTTKWIFDPDYKSNDDIDLIFQKPLYFQIKGIPCKALLDVIVINHTKKTIQIYDLKTTSETVINFPNSIRKFRYDIQLAWYQLGLILTINKLNDDLSDIKKDITRYTVLLPAFIVESSVYTNNPVIYTITEELLNIGLYGRPEMSLKKNNHKVTFSAIVGISKLIDDYIWYLNNSYDNDRVLVDNNFNLNVNWDGIVSKTRIVNGDKKEQIIQK
jgi:hypothetical protein